MLLWLVCLFFLFSLFASATIYGRRLRDACPRLSGGCFDARSVRLLMYTPLSASGGLPPVSFFSLLLHAHQRRCPLRGCARLLPVYSPPSGVKVFFVWPYGLPLRNHPVRRGGRDSTLTPEPLCEWGEPELRAPKGRDYSNNQSIPWDTFTSLK